MMRCISSPQPAQGYICARCEHPIRPCMVSDLRGHSVRFPAYFDAMRRCTYLLRCLQVRRCDRRSDGAGRGPPCVAS